MEVSLAFISKDALNVVMKVGKEVGWIPSPSSPLASILKNVLNLSEMNSSEEDFITCHINVTQIWLGKKFLKNSCKDLEAFDLASAKNFLYLRYKFHDQDTVVSKPYLIKSNKKDKEVFNVKMNYQKAFVCKLNQFLIYYLREENMEMQIWFTQTRSKRKRSSGSDILLGAIRIELSCLLESRLSKQTQTSGPYPLFQAGLDDITDTSIQLGISLSLGNDGMTYETNESCQSESSEEEEVVEKVPEVISKMDFFVAFVSIERAMYVPNLPPLDDMNKKKLTPSFYVSFPVASNVVEKTKHVVGAPCIVWNDAREVKLARKVFDENPSKITFRIWQKDESPPRSADRVVGYATVDISLLTNGFPAIVGWYNVLDVYGRCQGEIKIGITPSDPQQLVDFKGSLTSWRSTYTSLRSVPLICPVTTHLGGAYYPGVSCQFARTPGWEKRESVKDKVDCLPNTSLPSPTSKESKNSPVPSSHPFGNAPRSFSEAQLLQQMEELDKIRLNLHHKLLSISNTVSPSTHIDVQTDMPSTPPSQPSKTVDFVNHVTSSHTSVQSESSIYESSTTSTTVEETTALRPRWGCAKVNYFDGGSNVFSEANSFIRKSEIVSVNSAPVIGSHCAASMVICSSKINRTMLRREKNSLPISSTLSPAIHDFAKSVKSSEEKNCKRSIMKAARELQNVVRLNKSEPQVSARSNISSKELDLGTNNICEKCENCVCKKCFNISITSRESSRTAIASESEFMFHNGDIQESLDLPERDKISCGLRDS